MNAFRYFGKGMAKEAAVYRNKSLSLVSLVITICLLALSAPALLGQACNNNINLGLQPSKSLTFVGDVINYTITIDNTAAGNCDVSNIVVTLFLPNQLGGAGTVIYTNPGSLTGGDPGSFVTCPGGVGCAPGPYSYTVSQPDVTGQPGNGYPCSASTNDNANGNPRVVIAKDTLTGSAYNPGGGPFAGPSSRCNGQQTPVITPCLNVIKQVACDTGGAACSTLDPASYGGKATGLTGSTFCYRIIVNNCTTGGSLPLTIHSLNDSQYGNLLGIFPPNTTVGSGGSVTGFVSEVASSDLTNVVTVVATNGTTSISDVATAIVDVVTAHVSCTKSVASLDGVPQNIQSLLIPQDAVDHLVVWGINVVNDGQAPLTVTVSDSPFNNTGACSPTLPSTIQMEPGGTATYQCSEVVNCTNLPNGEVIINTNIVTATVGSFDEVEVCPSTIVLTNICTATVSCSSPCITRTMGFWYPRPSSTDPNCATLLAAIQANGGSINLGFMTLPSGVDWNNDGAVNALDTLAEAESFFYLLRSQTGENNGLQTLHKRAATLCMKRKIIAAELIAAIANVELFGASPQACLGEEGIDLIARAQEAAACDDISAILYYAGLLDQFNNAGSTNPLPPPWKSCIVNQVGAKKIARDPTTQANCSSTVNCTVVPTVPSVQGTAPSGHPKHN